MPVYCANSVRNCCAVGLNFSRRFINQVSAGEVSSLALKKNKRHGLLNIYRIRGRQSR